MSDPRPTLSELRLRILAHLAPAIEAAAKRLHAAAAGQSVFADQAQLRATLTLLRLVPTFLAEMRELDATVRAAALKAIEEARKNCPPPLIPKCQICGAGPGAHWTEDCAQNPNRRRY